MKVLITGMNGQLGHELLRTVPKEWQIVALPSDRMDIRNHGSVLETVEEYAPGLIINAAAYTAVDKAEEEKEQAHSVNAAGPANLAVAATKIGCRLIHISTDFIFDGTKSSPYLPGDTPNPLGEYGASKLAGEREVSRILQGKEVIIRTAWVYSAHGRNFVKTMLNLMKRLDELSIVDDQIGSPTWAKGLAETVWNFAARPELTGTYHWTDAGVASWYDFAVAIKEEAVQQGLLDHPVLLHPIRTDQYPLPAKRPPYSVLDKSSSWNALGMKAPHWRENLRNMLAEMK